jgi:hypothetical protein
MVRTRGIMDVLDELPKNSRLHQEPPPLSPPPVALDQLLATQNALM